MRQLQAESLTGVTLLHPVEAVTTGDTLHEFPPDSPIRKSIAEYAETQRHTADLARRSGALVLGVTDHNSPPVDEDTYWQCRAYVPSYHTTQEFLAAERDTLDLIPRQSVAALLAEDKLEAVGDALSPDNPIVLAYSALERGCGKYLLDSPDQWRRFMRFVYDSAGAPLGLDQAFDPAKFEVRPFVRTPSDFYTSFRVITDASGAVIAGGMYYSGHTKTGKPRRIINDRINYTRPGSLIRYIRTSLEDPTSDYFLNAADPRSNVDCGGTAVALMGDNRQAPTELERSILQAHGIDPNKPAVPDKLITIAKHVGQKLGPNLHLLTATDFIDGYCCEVNSSPGGALYAKCYPERVEQEPRSAIAMRQEALLNLADKHNPTSA